MIYEQSNLFLEYPLCLKRVVDVLFGCFSSHQQDLMEISITFTKGSRQYFSGTTM